MTSPFELFRGKLSLSQIQILPIIFMAIFEREKVVNFVGDLEAMLCIVIVRI